MKKKPATKTTNDQRQLQIELVVSAALRYFVGVKKLSFLEFEEDLQPFVEAYVGLLPGFKIVSAKLHHLPNGDRYDVGFMFDEYIVGVQLFEVEPGLKSTTTFH